MAVLRAAISGLTNGEARHNVALTASLDGALTWQWQERSSGTWLNIFDATSATFTPIIGTNVTDQASLRAVPDGDTALASLARVVRYAPPVLDTAGSISGVLTDGATLTGTPATFTGDDLTITTEWLERDGDVLVATGDFDTTRTAVLAYFYRFRTTASNSGGSVIDLSPEVGPIAEGTDQWTFSADTVLTMPSGPRWTFSSDTALTMPEAPPAPSTSGIGFMAIGSTFIVG